MMIPWMKRLKSEFGVSLLWLICLIYFTQGFRSFVWTAVSYLLKDKLKLSPSASQFVSSIAFFPWSIKPLYGILSDCIPIKGRRRIPYLMISTVLSLFPWLLLGLSSSLRSSKSQLTIFLTMQNLGSAMADVVIDAMIAEAVRFEKVSFAGDLQSLSWLSMALGGICGSLLGGYALSNLNMETIFLLFSLLPMIQLFSCSFVKEKSVSEVSPETPIAVDSNGSIVLEDRNVGKNYNGNTTRRKRGQKNDQKRQYNSKRSPVLVEGDFLISKWFHSVKETIYSLCGAFRQPIIIRSMSWFFLALVAVPNLSTVMFYYQTELLNLEASFLGTARVVGWSGLMLGTFIYNHYLKRMRLRRILMYAHIGLFTVSLLDIFLVSRLNVTYGISDRTMVLFGSAIADAINQLKLMPFLILSGQLCPPGIEGTLFALFMSINNLGNTLGSFMGASLASILNITSGSFGNLLLGLSIHTLSTLVPITFLFLIPKEATGISA